MKKRFSLMVFCLFVYCFYLFFASSLAQGSGIALNFISKIDYLDAFEARNTDGTINAVIEIPAGTNEKWEFDKEAKEIKLERRNGRPRIVKYLGYPGNYGMIPQTILPKENGGDGDPLDVLVIGGPSTRGAVVKAKLIGVLKYEDRGEQDDKLIAVLPETVLGAVDNFSDLENKFPEALKIIITWFNHYKGPGKMILKGQGSEKEATAILDKAIDFYRNSSEN